VPHRKKVGDTSRRLPDIRLPSQSPKSLYLNVQLLQFVQRPPLLLRAHLHLRRRFAPASAANGGVALGTTDGSIEVTITPSQTAALQPGNYSYALELTSPSGVKTRILRGTLTNHPRAPHAH
jgi:hypothetical protein